MSSSSSSSFHSSLYTDDLEAIEASIHERHRMLQESHAPSSSPTNASSSTKERERERDSSSAAAHNVPLTPSRKAKTKSATPSMNNNTQKQSDDINKNFKVVVRIRPPLPRELDNRYRDAVKVEDDAISISENGMGATPSLHLNPDGSITPSPSPAPVHRFTFDAVYDQDARQIDVYRHTARDAVLSVLQGYNATLLAYGQTGTGKTFTMEGFDDLELRGIIPRSVEEIFHYIQNTAHTNARFLVRASYLQIYNEVISDLLKPERQNLAIREDKKKGVFVEGLSEWVVRSPKEVYGLIKRGTSIRATGSTRINETSSRSHALFIIIVEQNEGEQEEEKVYQSFKVGKLNLVDLAGSERVRISGAKGRRLEESKYINQSLSALGNVIAALTEGNRQHIPYRDSKVTRILEDSIGGNCRTTMMAMISPAVEAFLESLSTLKFANRAKNIKNEARINEDLDEKALLRRYERELKKLRQELQARSRNVVDKRKLIEVEEQRRRAEQDKMAALMNMERLSRDLMTEKQQKKKLEERIKEMNSQLLVGGHTIHETAAFKAALQEEQDRIRTQYSIKLAELEKEREQMEEEKAQTSRYKQLLLKQRDIMIQLTARLNERDQSILLLQEELDAYDKHQRAMEDELDQKRHRLIQLQKMNINDGDAESTEQGGGAPPPNPAATSNAPPANSNYYGLFPIDEAPYFEENATSPLHTSNQPRTNPAPVAYGDANNSTGAPTTVPANAFQLPPNTYEQKISDLMDLIHRKDMELEEVKKQQQQQAQFNNNSSFTQDKLREQQYLASIEKLKSELHEKNDNLSLKESESLRLREELARLKSLTSSNDNSELRALQIQNSNLMNSLQQLQAQLQQKQQNGNVEVQYKDALNSLKKKYDVQIQERAALKVILEKKMKALIDSIASTALSPTTSSSAASPAPTLLPARTRREIEVLQRLVEASLTALKNSDRDETSNDVENNSVKSTSSSSAATPSSTTAPPRSPASNYSTYSSSSFSSSRPPVAVQSTPNASAGGAGSATLNRNMNGEGIERLIQQRKEELQRLENQSRNQQL